MRKQIINGITGLVVGILLASCGGGGASVSEGGIGGTGVSRGSVSGYGSIIVNGVHFDTAGAVVTKDDNAPVTNINDADIDQLINIGMVVTVKGTINDNGTGTAESISYEDILEGPVVATPAGNVINVLGQTVRVIDGVTRYACDSEYTVCNFASFADVAASQVIEVSGFIDENKEIVAAYIELKEDTYVQNSDVFEIKGQATVSGSDIIINGLTIINANTTGVDGQFIEAKGRFDGTSTMDATEVEIKDESFDIADADKAELEGIASSGCTTNSCDFILAGTTVRVDNNTSFNTGTALNIIAGLKLGVKGSLQNGILFAADIEFK